MSKLVHYYVFVQTVADAGSLSEICVCEVVTSEEETNCKYYRDADDKVNLRGSALRQVYVCVNVIIVVV